MTDRVDEFETDVASSAEALERLLDRWRPLDGGLHSRIAFVGLGSSRFAADVVAPLLRARGRSAWVEVAGSGAGTQPADDLTLVAISASGASAEVVQAAERHRGHGRVIALTNRSDSRLAAAVDEIVALEAGEERAGIACRSFRATIAALALLTGLVSTDDLRPAVGTLAARADEVSVFEEVCARLDGSVGIDVLGDGPMLGVAEQAALMLREAPRLSAHAWPTTEWLHTGVYLAWPGQTVVLYPGSDADDEVQETGRRRSATLVSMPASELSPVQRAIADSLWMESIAARSWRRAGIR